MTRHRQVFELQVIESAICRVLQVEALEVKVDRVLHRRRHPPLAVHVVVVSVVEGRSDVAIIAVQLCSQWLRLLLCYQDLI